MADPTVVVELEMADGDYVDVSADLRSGYTNRGRQQELARYQAGHCSLELGNAGRAYDPLFTASPYYPYIKPGRGLRVSAVYNAVSYPIFVGRVDGWSERPNGPHDAVAVVEATDVFKDLAKADLPSSAYALEVAADGPVDWFRLDDSVGATSLRNDGTAGTSGLPSSLAPTFGATTLISRDGGAAMSVTALKQGFRVERAGAAPGSTASWSAEWVMQTSQTGAFMMRLFGSGVESVPNPLVYVEMYGGDGELWFRMDDGATVDLAKSTVAVNDGAPHHVVVTFDATSKAMRIYVDGVDRTDPVEDLVYTGGAIPAKDRYGVAYDAELVNGKSLGAGTMDEVALYGSVLSAVRIAAHSAARATPWNNDTPGQRIGRILDYVGTPVGLRDLDPGSSVLQSATLATSALEAAQKVAESEFGPLYVRADGTIVFEDRHSNLNEASQATFSDQPDAYVHDAYLDLPGTTGNYASTPDSVVLSSPTVLWVAARVSADDWSGLLTQDVVSKYGSAGNRSWYFFLTTTGTLRFSISTDGTNVTAGTASSVAVPHANGAYGWVGVEWRSSDGRLQYWTAPDADVPVWAQLGVDRTLAAGATIWDGAGVVMVGSRGAGDTELFAGDFRDVQVGASKGGALIARFDAGAVVTTGIRTPTTLVSVTGETWTVVGTAWAWGGTPTCVYKDSTPRYDDTLIRNDVTISRAEGVAQRAEDAASIAEFGRYSFTADGLLHDDDDMSRDAADFILSEYKTPVRRITDLTVGPVPAGKEAAMYPQMLGRELTEKITVTEHPQGVDPVLSQASVIEGISQSFGPKHWQTKWQLSPALAGAFWQIGVAGFSEIGLTTRLGF